MHLFKSLSASAFTKIAVFFVSICFGTQANAACSFGNFNESVGVTMNVPLRVTEGSTCAIRSKYPQFIGSINVTRKASHGIAGKNADGGAYQPNPNFKGKDRFSYTVITNSNWVGGAGKVTTINVDVTVE